jgi:hypothetical protein
VKAAGLNGAVAGCPSRAGPPCSTVPPVPGDEPPSPNTKLGAAGLSGGMAASEAAAAVGNPVPAAPSAVRDAEVSERLESGGDMLGVLSARLRLNAGAAVAFAALPVPPGRTPNDRPESCVASVEDHAPGLAAAGGDGCCGVDGVPAADACAGGVAAADAVSVPQVRFD